MKQTLNTIVTVCCFNDCYKIKRREEWIDIGKPLYKLIQQEYSLSHGYCPYHAQLERAKLKRYVNDRV